MRPSGTISGTAEGDRIQVRADSPGFTANLSLITHGDRQSVSDQNAGPERRHQGRDDQLAPPRLGGSD